MNTVRNGALILAVFVPFLELFFNTTVVLGHIPYVAGSKHSDISVSLKVEDIHISKVVYQELTTEATQSWIRFEAQKGEELYFQIGIPYLPSLRDYRPSLVLVSSDIASEVDIISVVEREGIKVFHSPSGSEVTTFHERFTDTTSWILFEDSVELLDGGEYYLVSFSPEAESGKLWVAIGRQESFGPGDVARLPFVMSDVKSFHAADGVEIEPASGSSEGNSIEMSDGVADDMQLDVGDGEGTEDISVDFYLIGLGMGVLAVLSVGLFWRKRR